MTTDTSVAPIPRPAEPGPEHAALRRFHRDGVWEGVIRAGGMGPGTPEQTAKGSARHVWIQDGRWVVGDYEQSQFLGDGTFVLEWQLHWVCGWDPLAEEYRATTADNYGRAALLAGRIDGDRMVFETIGDLMPRIRLTWDVGDPEVVLWKNEMTVDGFNWFLVEEYRITPTTPT